MAEDKNVLLEEDAQDGEEATPRLSFEPSRKGSWSPRSRSAGRSDFFNKNGRHLFVIAMAILAALIGLVVGLLIGRSLPHKNSSGCNENPTEPVAPVAMPLLDWGDKVTLNGKSVDAMSIFESQLTTEDIRNYLYNISSQPHIAGSDRNRDLALDMFNEWKTFGFDSVELHNYSVLLSYPSKDNPNSLQLKDSSGNVLYDSHIAQEPPLTVKERNDDVVAPFNAYSANGTVTGPLVYVNYGTIEDFLYLTNGSFLSLNLSNYICIARYGNIFRGDKAFLAQKFGCKGLLLYSDPSKYAPSGTTVYPEGRSLPKYGIQRGSLLAIPGDPTSPTVPAISGIFHKDYEQLVSERVVPCIPVQPVSYGDIVDFMSQLSDHTPPQSWVGGLNLTYRILQSIDNTNETELTVNVYQTTRTIHNVVAKLYGKVEPDRQVIIGNHRDAWVFGAIDPGSGTAFIRTFAKTIGYLRSNTNWRPGRSLVLCSWDGEEYGAIGSTEWVEDFRELLSANTVAYLNIDELATGTQILVGAAWPLLYEPLWQAAKAVKSPNPNFATLYDLWLQTFPKNYDGVIKPRLTSVGSGSDHVSFTQSLGVSSGGVIFRDTSSFPVYHSLHDTFHWMSHFGDPTFTHLRAAGLIYVHTALSLTTSPLLPCKVTDYGIRVKEMYQTFQEGYQQLLEGRDISIDELGIAVMEFANAATIYEAERQKLNSSTFNLPQHHIVLRMYNDKLMHTERAFIHPEGLPGRPHYKHVIFAPSVFDSYGSSGFPSILDAIFSATHDLDPSSAEDKWNQVKKQIDIVRIHIRHAKQVLAEPIASVSL